MLNVCRKFFTVKKKGPNFLCYTTFDISSTFPSICLHGTLSRLMWLTGDRRHYKKGSSFWRHLCLWHQLFIFTYLVKPLIKVTVWPLHRRTLHQQSSVILTLLVRTCYQFTSLVIGLVNSWAAQWIWPIPIWHEYTLRSCWHSPPSWTAEKSWLRHEYFMLWATLPWFESHK